MTEPGARVVRDPQLLDRAWDLPVARTYARRIDVQSNASSCGVTSLANALRSLDVHTSERALAEIAPWHFRGWALGGTTLDRLALAARRSGAVGAEVLRGSAEALRVHLPRFNDPAQRYTINFDRARVFGRGPGHHSPVGGWLADEDLVLVLDVGRGYGAWLAPSHVLLRAAATRDRLSGQQRGLLRLARA